MPDGRGGTQLEDLPEEIIDSILIRLPSKDVGRCRAVSTSWRNATSTPEFMLRHHRRQPSIAIMNGQGMLVVFRAGSFGHPLWPFLPGAKHRGETRLRGACDGLLAVSWRSQFYVCNPVIRNHALLPQPPLCEDIANNIVGFYRHRPTGELRVLWVSRRVYDYSLYILTVGCDSPRHVEVRLQTLSEPSMEHELLVKLCYSDNFPVPVVNHGNLHWWHPYYARGVNPVDGQITVFDTEVESFRWMRSPAQITTYNAKLFDMMGTLAFSCSSRHAFAAIDVWVVQDYEAEIWAFKYRIDLSVVVTSFGKETTGTPFNSIVRWTYDMAVLNELELVIMVNGKHVLRCDIDGKFVRMVHSTNSSYYIELTPFRLEESIIPIPYHEMQEDDEEPFTIERV